MESAREESPLNPNQAEILDIVKDDYINEHRKQFKKIVHKYPTQK